MTVGRIPSVEGGIQPTLLTAKGDLISATAASTVARLPVGSDTQILVADSTASTGLKWATPTSSSTFVGCSVYKATTAQSIANNTDTTITFNTTEFDTDAFHNDSTNNSRITIPTGKAGKYLIIATIQYAASATGIRAMKVMLNGSTAVLDNHQHAPTPTISYRGSLSGIKSLAVADYIEMQTSQISGGNLDLNSGQANTRFAAIYLGA